MLCPCVNTLAVAAGLIFEEDFPARVLCDLLLFTYLQYTIGFLLLKWTLITGIHTSFGLIFHDCLLPKIRCMIGFLLLKVDQNIGKLFVVLCCYDNRCIFVVRPIVSSGSPHPPPWFFATLMTMFTSVHNPWRISEVSCWEDFLTDAFYLFFFLSFFIFIADPLVGSIATQYLQNREEHDRVARLWTKRYATWLSIIQSPPIFLQKLEKKDHHHRAIILFFFSMITFFYDMCWDIPLMSNFNHFPLTDFLLLLLSSLFCFQFFFSI